MRGKYSLLLLSTVMGGVLSAQSPSARRLVDLHHATWTTRDGLPDAGILAPLRTGDGYLWMGSAGALLRFDGARFVRIDSSSSSALRSAVAGTLWPLLVDRAGRLWVSRADGGMVVYERGVFREVLAADTARGLAGALVEDQTGRLWGLARRLFSIRNGRVEAPPLPPGVALSEVFGVAPDADGGVLLGTTTGQLWHLRARDTTRIATRRTQGVRPLLQDRDGRIWYSQAGVRGVREGVEAEVHAPGNATEFAASAALQLADQSIVFATRGNGLLRWRDGRVDQFSEQEGLTDAVVRGLHQDADGSLWVTTEGGLDRFRAAPFITLGRNHALPFEAARAIAADPDGGIWVGAFGSRGLFRLDGGVVRRADDMVRADSIMPPGKEPFILSAPSPNGGVWAHDRRHQFYRVSRDGLSAMPGLTLPSDVAIVTLEDARGALWIGNAPRGLGVWRSGTLRRIDIPGASTRTFISSIAQDAQGAIWATVVNPSAIFKVVDDRIVARIVSPDPARPEMAATVVEGIDTLWARAGGVLVRAVGGRVTTVPLPGIAPALPSIFPVLLIDNGYLWFAGESALGRVPLAALHQAADRGGQRPPAPELFGSSDGLQSAKLSNLVRRSATRAADGRLWFVTPAGLAVVDPAALRRPPRAVRAIVEEMLVDGVVSQNAHIPPNPSRVEIHFTATELQAPERVHIQYRLDGADREWVTAAGSRSAMYTQLRHGSYRFRVRVWNESNGPVDEATFDLRVAPAWYQTWWFFAITVLSVLAGGTAAIRARLREKERRAAERLAARFDAELSERTRLARDLHDTLLQGLTGITLQIQAVQDSLLRAPDAAHEALGRILDMTDATLRESRTMVWEMRAPELDAQELAVALESAAISLIGSSGITLAFDVVGTRHRLALDTETTVLRVGREAITNAVRHSGATTIHVVLAYETTRVCLTVTDNGRGLRADEESVSTAQGHWGLRGMRERAHRAGGTLQIAGTNATGTTLQLCLPIVPPP